MRFKEHQGRQIICARRKRVSSHSNFHCVCNNNAEDMRVLHATRWTNVHLAEQTQESRGKNSSGEDFDTMYNKAAFSLFSSSLIDKADNTRAFRVAAGSFVEISSARIRILGSSQRRRSCKIACKIRQSRRYVILADRTWPRLYSDARVTLSRTEASAIPSGERTSSSHSPAWDHWIISKRNVVL